MRRTILCGVATAVAAILCATALATTAPERLEEAVYTEETLGDLQKAVHLYQQVIADAEASRSVVAEAHYRLAACYLKQGDRTAAVAELRKLGRRYGDLPGIPVQARDVLEDITMPSPALLMPPETFFYAEVGSPGGKLEQVLEMLRAGSVESPPGRLGPATGLRWTPTAALAAVLNRDILEELTKVHGCAVGVQAPRPGGPSGVVCVLYPGESDIIRGLVRTSLATFTGISLGGFQAIVDPGGIDMAHVIGDDAIIIAAPGGKLGWCVGQYDGTSHEPSLASEAEAPAALSRAERRNGALAAWLDTERGAPFVGALARAAGAAAGLGFAEAALDAVGPGELLVRHTLDEDGPCLEARMIFEGGEPPGAYKLVQTPPLRPSAFGVVPPEAVALLTFALDVRPDSQQAAAVSGVLARATGIHIAPEAVAGLQAVTAFMLPPTPEAMQDPLARDDPLAPLLGLVIASRDPTATQVAVNGFLEAADAQARLAAGMPARADGGYVLDAGGGRPIVCHAAHTGSATVLSLARAPVEAALRAVRTGDSAAVSGPLAAAIARLPEGTSKAFLATVAGICECAAVLGDRRGAPEEVMDALAELAEAAGDTTLYLQTREGPGQVTAGAGLGDLAPLAAMLPAVSSLIAAAGPPGGLPGAPLEPSPVDVPYSPDQIVVDGDLSDWAGIPPMPLPYMGGGTGMVHLCWRADGLYAALEVHDHAVRVDLGEPWTGDAFELWIDKAFAREPSRALDSAAEQYIFTYDPAADGGRAPLLIPYGPNIGRESEAPSAWRRTDQGYALEVRIPSDFLVPAAMVQGTVMGLNFAVDEDGEPVEQFYFNKHLAYATPMLWGAVRLAGAPGGAPAEVPTALPSTSPGPEPVDVPYSPSRIAVDADLSDWTGIPPMPLPFMGRDAGMVHLCWREDGLYAALEVEDDSITVNLGEPWTGDAFELWVDRDLRRDDQYAGGGAEQYIFTYDRAADGGRAPLMIVYGPNQGRESEVPSAWRRTDDGYLLEVRIPARFLAAGSLAEGTVMGLNFAVDDDGRATEQFYVDKDDRQAYGIPALWGTVRLTASPAD
jgi:hypothetical protein